MNEPKLIFLEPVPDDHFGDRDWCQDDVWEGSVRYALESDALAREAVLQKEIARQKRYVQINGDSAHGKHMEGLRYRDERDALQQRLTATDERLDLLEGLLRRVVGSSVLSFEQDAPEGLESLEVDICAALKPVEGGGDSPCACTGCDASKASSSLFCAAHRSAKSRTRGQDPLTAEGLEWLMQSDGEQQ